jgi:hypothetical protein
MGIGLGNNAGQGRQGEKKDDPYQKDLPNQETLRLLETNKA